MNIEIMKQIEEVFNIKVEWHSEGCYFYTDENGHSEWNLEGELTYSTHFFNN